MSVSEEVPGFTKIAPYPVRRCSLIRNTCDTPTSLRSTNTVNTTRLLNADPVRIDMAVREQRQGLELKMGVGVTGVGVREELSYV